MVLMDRLLSPLIGSRSVDELILCIYDVLYTSYGVIFMVYNRRYIDTKNKRCSVDWIFDLVSIRAADRTYNES